jgi:hypothetical protein
MFWPCTSVNESGAEERVVDADRYILSSPPTHYSLGVCPDTRAAQSESAHLLGATHMSLVIDHEHAPIVMILILAASVCGHTDACPAVRACYSSYKTLLKLCT